jgi:3-dehydroquinate synthase
VKFNYKINNLEYSIIFRKNIDSSITKEINYLNCDKKILLIFDKNIEQSQIDKTIKFLKETGCKVIAFNFTGNKKNKNQKILFKIIDLMIHNKFTKKSLLISFGGGVLGDVCALAASLYYRGLIYFHIPSTMTAIVDSCIGGKTAINYNKIINSVGNYYHPHCVFIFHEIIEKLPEREFLSGVPEIIKCGLIKNNNILSLISINKEKFLNKDLNIIKKIVLKTLETKIFFFKKDIYENKERLMLNFGHTFAHAIEMTTGNDTNREFLRHGEAVGIGILCELYYAHKGKSKLYNQVKLMLKNYNLPTDIKHYKATKKQNLLDSIYKNIYLDKKKINNYPRYVFLKKKFFPKIKNIEDANLLVDTINEIL